MEIQIFLQIGSRTRSPRMITVKTTVQTEERLETEFIQRKAGKACRIWAGSAENSKGKAFNHPGSLSPPLWKLASLLRPEYLWVRGIKGIKFRNQDGRLGGHGIRLSSHLGHLPGTGGGPQTPKGTGRNSEWLGKTWVGGGRREEKCRQDGTGAPEGLLGEGRSSHTPRDPPTVRGSTGQGETLGRAEDWTGTWPAFPLPAWTPESLLRSRAWSSTLWGSLQPHWA